MVRVTACTNQKGGVGKTTTTAKFGAALAQAGRKKTLVVDFDPQANLTSCYLGVRLADRANRRSTRS